MSPLVKPSVAREATYLIQPPTVKPLYIAPERTPVCPQALNWSLHKETERGVTTLVYRLEIGEGFLHPAITKEAHRYTVCSPSQNCP